MADDGLIKVERRDGVAYLDVPVYPAGRTTIPAVSVRSLQGGENLTAGCLLRRGFPLQNVEVRARPGQVLDALLEAGERPLVYVPARAMTSDQVLALVAQVLELGEVRPR